MAEPIVETRGLKKYFSASKRSIGETILRKAMPLVKAVDNINLQIREGEVLALVGESGSGKTTLGRLIATLETPSEGEVYFLGQKVTKQNRADVRKQIQIVFQNPYESLDPRSTVRGIVTEPLLKSNLSRNTKDATFKTVLDAVGLPANFAERRPKDLSGGQRQRVAVARAIISYPKLIVLDEPTSALDASVQSQVLNLLVDLRNEFNFSYLFITHNISIAKYISDRVATMYAGQIIELGPTLKVIDTPKHPYTQALLKSVPSLERKEFQPPSGEVPSLVNLPAGCRYNPRCPFVMDICRTTDPLMFNVDEDDVACWLYK
jgi:peptide/nickel transport system ATP-binding protein